ncbi:MAG: GMP/IMP nucleotidase [Gammaproteobacteria bacterium]|nr:GMP/IMP nucleotidase [Gammaproteobacteria bacterium]
MIDWTEVETVLLDMDGTLLDLHFDDFFWQQQLPLKWGEMNGIDIEEARSRLLPIFRKTEASLSWYCLDYWSEQLQMDVFKLSFDISHLISLRPYVIEFLSHLDKLDKNIVLVTNSHEKFIELKMQKTGIENHFHHMFNSHDFGHPKENTRFWEVLAENIHFANKSTVLFDDNLSVLRSARQYGIEHLLGIARPSSQAPLKDTAEFKAVSSFRELL